VLGSGIALQPHQAGSPSNQSVTHNTVIGDGPGISVRNVTGPIVLANNAVYSQSGAAIALFGSGLEQVTVAGNVGHGGLVGADSGYTAGNGVSLDFVDGHFNGQPPLDLFPSLDSALIGSGSAPHTSLVDFNGTARDGAADVGAYKYSPGGNPGWALAPGFKGVGGGVVPAAPVGLRAD